MNKHILLVDDSPTVRSMVQLLLRGKPYELQLACDGAEGVARACERTPDLVLLDVMMPVMDGLEACRRMRELPALAEVPIVMLSTRSEEEFVESAYLSGCNDYLPKPFDAGTLLAKLESLLAA